MDMGKRKYNRFFKCKKMPLRNYENILVFYKKPPIYNPQGLIKLQKRITHKSNKRREKGNYGTCSNNYETQYKNYPRSIIHFARDTQRLHPTQKPVQLIEYLIKTYTDEGMTVLDNCMGSGTTGVACMNTNRRFIGMELNEHYFNIATKRIGTMSRKSTI